MANVTQIPHPAALKLSGNISNEWKRFKSQWQNYEIATDVGNESTAKRAAIFLACIGTEAFEQFQTFELSAADSRKIEKVIEAFERYFVGQTNVTYERYVFNRRTQETDETFDAFFSDLRKLVKSCEYGTLEESIIRDRIVIGIRDDSTRKKLLQTRELDLKQAVDICKASESASRQLKAISSKHDMEVNEVRKQTTNNRSRSKSREMIVSRCHYCGGQHIRSKESCPAYGKICNLCKGKNHYRSVCRKNQTKKMEVRCLDAEEEESEEESEEEILALDRSKDKRIYSKFQVSGQSIRFLLDSGATVNLLPIDVVRNLNCNDKIKPATSGLHMFDGTMLKTAGVVNLAIKHPITQCEQVLEFYVTTVQGPRPRRVANSRKAASASASVRLRFSVLPASNSCAAPPRSPWRR